MAAVDNAVLIVDDEEHVLRSIKRLLRRDGYEIHLADGGRAALELLEAHDVAVIICDQRMPGMSGAEVLAEVYKRQPDTTRITLTGYTDLAAAQESINQGHVNHFLLKPWDDDHLRSVVRDGVRAYRMIKDNRRLEELTRRQKEELEAWNHRLEEQVAQRTQQLTAKNERLRALQEQLEQSLRDTVMVTIGVLEASDPSIGTHTKRVAQLAHALATQLELSDRDVRDVEFAARLHDIGKVSKAFREKGSRSARTSRGGGHAGWRHSDSGYAILSHVAGFEAIARAVRHQHEHYDGNGYPDKLREDDIPLASRIIAVVNRYDEAVFYSTYPTNASRETGKRVLLEGQGKRFDPALVGLFLQYLDKHGMDACDDSEVELSPNQLKMGMQLSRPLRNHEGILLLKPGTVLTADHIKRIQSMSNIDPLLDGVFVSCAEKDDREVGSDGEQVGPEQPPRPPDPGSSADRETSPSPARPDAPAAAVPTPNVATHTAPPEQTTAARPDARGGTGDGANAEPQGPRKPRILIVDDVVMLCNALKRELRPEGFSAVTTQSGHEALALVQTEKFDLVITDVMMPVMGGEELIGRLHGLVPELPCIVLTGNAKMDEVRRIVKAPNVAGILVKPWDKSRLMDLIKSALAGCNAEAADLSR